LLAFHLRNKIASRTLPLSHFQTRRRAEVAVLIGRGSTAFLALILFVAALPADGPVAPSPRVKLPVAPAPREKLGPVDVAALLKLPNEAARIAKLYDTDRGALLRTYTVVNSPVRTERLRKFDANWLAALKAVDFEKVSPAAREELIALRSKVEDNAADVNRRAAHAEAVAPLTPFAGAITDLEESRRRVEQVDAIKSAGRVDALRKQVEKLKAKVEAGTKSGKFAEELHLTKWSADKAANTATALRANLKAWNGFYTGYDPEFTWWVAEPYRAADAALGDYIKALGEAEKKIAEPGKAPDVKPTAMTSTGPSDAPDLAKLLESPRSEFIPAFPQYFRSRADAGRWLEGLKSVKFNDLSRDGQVDYLLFKTQLEREVKRQSMKDAKRPPVPKDDTGIVGRPIGREALMVELAGELIPHTPEELIAIAKTELAWCDAEMLKASREMGLGDDWRAALEKVKQSHLKPGEQPKLIRDVSDMSIEYLKKRDLVTIPPLAEETWRMIMMSPERQLVSPFFTGGEVISVAFPASSMAHEAKLQSLRGNNLHFARATVQHELIPGHHLQIFMNARNNPHRSLFGTPFSIEGWALYWELVLYGKGDFAKCPEDRIGFLTWRKHRCCRIIFSLGYHMGDLTPRQCVDLLTDRVGFEPENALAEVRRSFAGGYGPLYQAAYLLGGFQFWELRKELVGSGKMTERQFHDAILAEHSMPIAMLRAVLLKQPLPENGLPPWKFNYSQK
jgi:uncharacterized protein (DUF885 family)